MVCASGMIVHRLRSATARNSPQTASPPYSLGNPPSFAGLVEARANNPSAPSSVFILRNMPASLMSCSDSGRHSRQSLSRRSARRRPLAKSASSSNRNRYGALRHANCPSNRGQSGQRRKEKAGNPERVTRPHTWTASHNEAVAFVASDCKARQSKKGTATRTIARASREARVRLLRGVLPGEQHVVRLEPALHRAGVEAVGRIDHERVHLLLAQHRVERVRQLDLAAHAGLHVG